MKNKDTNTGYQKVVRVGDQKRKIVKNTIGIIFFFKTRIHYFYTGSFQVPPEKKSPPPKVPILTQNPNLIYDPPI